MRWRKKLSVYALVATLWRVKTPAKKKENERLKGRAELAKKKLSEIVSQLPEHG